MVPKRPVMIACVTFETAMVIEPMGYYEPGELFLFHYVSDKDPERAKIYTAFYEEVVRQARDRFPGILIHELSSYPIWDFSLMVRALSNEVSEIRSYNKTSRILINVSSGSKEFCMAGLIVSQRCDNVDAFTVPTEEYSVSLEEVAKIYYRDGKPLGLTEHCREPKDIPKFDLFVTDENLVRGLRVFISLCDKPVYSTAQQVIEEMKKQGVWQRDEGMEESMYYSRHYKAAWLKNGWIEKDPKISRRFIPTERGRLVAETFFTR